MRYLILFLLLCPLFMLGQGKLVLVGGGAEEIGGWSDIPYKKIVDQAFNKRIAVISYADETSFIPDYFIALGAAAADNIKIDSKDLADLQTTYDSLMKYDAFFFKGGDQSFYYNYLKNTKTHQAITDKFNAGGVLSGTSAGMAILSGVIFTATKNSVYPDDMLANFNNSSATLADDFINVLPGFIVDTHFTERGRGARLIGFLTQWYLQHNELLTGIGVDDRTAFCIDENKKGFIFGTGTVSIYSSDSYSAYLNNRPVVDSLHVTQLLHGNSIDLISKEIISGPSHPLTPPVTSENGNYQVFLSGGAGSSGNNAFLNAFIAVSPADTTIVITAPGQGKTYTDQLTVKDAPFIVVETSEASNNIAKLDLRNAIRRSNKFLFAENVDGTLFDFLENGPTGILIKGHLKRNNVVTGFVGEDSRYAGRKFVTNHRGDLYNAYYGRLNYEDGLAMLGTSTVMANTYDVNTSDFYENTTAAVPYAMVHDSLKYGIYLEREGYLHLYQQDGANYFSATGSLSTIVITNRGTTVDLESQPVNSTGDTRDYAGFSNMKYTVLNGPAKMKVGVPHPTNDPPYMPEVLTATWSSEIIAPFPNPSATGVFYLSSEKLNNEHIAFSISDILANPVQKNEGFVNGILTIDLSEFPNGIYVLKCRTASKQFSALLIKG